MHIPLPSIILADASLENKIDKLQTVYTKTAWLRCDLQSDVTDALLSVMVVLECSADVEAPKYCCSASKGFL